MGKQGTGQFGTPIVDGTQGSMTPMGSAGAGATTGPATYQTPQTMGMGRMSIMPTQSNPFLDKIGQSSAMGLRQPLMPTQQTGGFVSPPMGDFATQGPVPQFSGIPGIAQPMQTVNPQLGMFAGYNPNPQLLQQFLQQKPQYQPQMGLRGIY